MYGSYRDVLKRSDRFTPEGRPVWPLGIHGPSDNGRNPKGEDPQGLRAKHESVGRNGIGGKVVA